MQTEEAQNKRTELQAGLAMHTGTETFFRHWAGSMLFTEGIHFLAEQANAFWLIDNVAWGRLNPRVSREAFVAWKLRVNADRSAELIADDGNSAELLRQHVPWTDFPLEEITLYLTDGVLLLPSEY